MQYSHSSKGEAERALQGVLILKIVQPAWEKDPLAFQPVEKPAIWKMIAWSWCVKIYL